MIASEVFSPPYRYIQAVICTAKTGFGLDHGYTAQFTINSEIFPAVKLDSGF